MTIEWAWWKSCIVPIGTVDFSINRKTTSPATCRPGWAPLALGGDLAAAEPRNIRYTLLRTAGRIILDQRRRRGRIPETWPWTDALATVFTGTFALPAPT